MIFKLDEKRISRELMKKRKSNTSIRVTVINYWTGFHLAAFEYIEDFPALCCNPVILWLGVMVWLCNSEVLRVSFLNFINLICIQASWITSQLVSQWEIIILSVCESERERDCVGAVSSRWLVTTSTFMPPLRPINTHTQSLSYRLLQLE